MSRQKASSLRVGPNPNDQSEEREARIAAILERVRRHGDKAQYHQRMAAYYQREADRHIYQATHKRAQPAQPRKKSR